jgi:hypothetical protein
MADMRTFCASSMDPRDLSRMISSWLSLHDFESQIISLPDGGIAVQARQPELWRSILGMSSALNVTFITKGNDLVVEADAGRWADKVAVGAVGAFILHPLLITLAYGAWKQCQLPDRVFGVVEQYIKERQASARATRIPVKSSDDLSPDQSSTAPLDRVSAPPVGMICRSCGSDIGEGAKYCEKCGARQTPESIIID